MSAPTPPEPQRPFAADFMDDYFAEADEHIVSVRRNLMVIEESLGSDLPQSALEELFRSFHSLKGISAMVELRDAELLAHQMESCLRAVRDRRVTLTSINFDVLIDGAKALEDVVQSHRNRDMAAPSASVLQRLAALAETEPDKPPGVASAAIVSVMDATDSRARAWKVTFVPTPELVARGIKVDSVRSRLLEIGRVVSVTPTVLSTGGVSFGFEVETTNDDELARLQEDGVTYEPIHSGAISPLEPELVAERPRDVGITNPTNFVRVDLARLDELMRLVGEMVVSRSRLDDTLQRVERHVPFQEWRVLQEHASRLERQLRDLREGVMRVRLVPVGEVFRRMPFVVRDLARDTGKRVRLELAGQGTEIDKFLVERMMDPVLHLVRNAVSHAIEPSDERAAAGKPPEGMIRLGASTAGEAVILEISDDGRGIDVSSVATRARAAGMLLPDGALDARTLLDIICASGFSTRDEADRASGRGVGMAVVRSTVEDLGGVLAVETHAGRGTTFTITLPLTLAITDAIIAQVGDQTFAIPQSAIREVMEVDASLLRPIEQNELVTYRGRTLPIVRLARLFSIAVTDRPRFHAIVVGTGRAAIGLLVDRIAGQQEIVVKAVTDPLIKVTGVSGATELGDGRLVLILDVAALSRTLRDRPPRLEGKLA